MVSLVPRFTAADSVLLVVDVQDKLLAKMPTGKELVRSVAFLLDVAHLLNVPALATEQYPKGLGPTTDEIARRIPGDRLSKTAFSCCGATGFLGLLRQLGRKNIILTGMETHVCVAQTAFDLLESGFHVFLPVDAVASRKTLDAEVALRRLEKSGVISTTAEAVAFEWVGDASHTQFKAMSKLVIERA